MTTVFTSRLTPSVIGVNGVVSPHCLKIWGIHPRPIACSNPALVCTNMPLSSICVISARSLTVMLESINIYYEARLAGGPAKYRCFPSSICHTCSYIENGDRPKLVELFVLCYVTGRPVLRLKGQIKVTMNGPHDGWPMQCSRTLLLWIVFCKKVYHSITALCCIVTQNGKFTRLKIQQKCILVWLLLCF